MANVITRGIFQSDDNTMCYVCMGMSVSVEIQFHNYKKGVIYIHIENKMPKIIWLRPRHYAEGKKIVFHWHTVYIVLCHDITHILINFMPHFVAPLIIE